MENWTSWYKSQHSNPNGACVMVRHDATHVQIGDTVNPDGPPLTVTRAKFAELVNQVRLT